MSAHRRRGISAAVVLGLVLLTTAGCGGTYDAAVMGAVKLNGNPVPRGTVTFAPQSTGPAAYGLIQADGTYVVHTGREEGLPSGQYVVTVAANEAPTAQGRDGGPPPTGKPITPEWYRDPTTSGLNFTVEPGDNQINLDLTTTPPAGWTPPRGRR